MNEIRILYDAQQRRAVLLSGGRPIGLEFVPLTEGRVHTDARAAAEWFLHGIRRGDCGRTVPLALGDLDRNQFRKLRIASYSLLSEASRLATAAELVTPERVEFVFRAAYRGLLHEYAAAVLAIAKVESCENGAAADALNRMLLRTSWDVGQARDEALRALAIKQTGNFHRI